MSYKEAIKNHLILVIFGAMFAVIIAMLIAIFFAIISSTAHAQSRHRGALVWKEKAPQVLPVIIHSAGIPEHFSHVTFDRVAYDTCGCWDQVRHRMVVPRGSRFVRVMAQVIFAHTGQPAAYALNNVIRQIVIKQNYVNLHGWYDNRPGWAVGHLAGHTATTTDVQAVGPVLEVRPGDDFMVEALHTEAFPLEIRATNGTWFSIEIIE